MGNRENHPNQVVIKSPSLGKTDIWNKDSSGRTTEAKHQTVYKDSGNVTNHWGRIISNNKK